MYDHLWFGVDRKLEEALRCYEEMGRSLQPPAWTTPMYAIQFATDTIADTRWQDTFYAHVGTFLAKVRSVPEVIEACFGADRVLMKMPWWSGLTTDEQSRRAAFSKQFGSDYDAFRKHHLTNQRNVSEHRLGYPNIEGKVPGPFGAVHTASPTNRIPTAESRPLEPNIGNDAALMWAATLPPHPVRPRWDQFTINGKPLFDECRAYVQLASNLRARAGPICEAVHGSHSLSTPPNS
jgi:hypothetical protein